MKPISQASFIPWRFNLILLFIFLVIMGLIGRVFNLTILDKSFLMREGDERVLRLVNAPAIRAMIVDRNGYPLAVSSTVYSVWMNPHDFSLKQDSLSQLSRYLELKPKAITTLSKHYHKSKREFVYLKRGISPEVANKIRALHITGINLQEEYRRFYPEGEIAAHVLGFTNIDDRGQEGMELAYDDWLSGKPGKKWVIKDRLGQVISEVKSVQEREPGHELTLSMDRKIQYLAYRELLAGVTEHHARSGSVVVLDAKTGEVLAMVNQPSFNPNNRATRHPDSFRNRAITDTFEPGSTMKAFSVAIALASRKYTPTTVIDTHPGWLRVDNNPHHIVRDHERRGLLTVTEVLQHSSNVGVAKMVLSLPPDTLWNLLHQVGFGELTGVNFPGEQSGSLTKHQSWGRFTLATLSFGYGLSVTPLQLALAYAVIANQGLKVPPSLFRLEAPPVGKQVMNAVTARKMSALLEAVTRKEGGGFKAQVPGYRVAGKTGTSKIAQGHGYAAHQYISSFVGFAPVSNPRFIVAVVIHDPQGKKYYGADVSAPVFQKIMEGCLRMMNVSPDDSNLINRPLA